MSHRHIKYTEIKTKKGYHIKVMYSFNGVVKRFSTGVFIDNMTASQKKVLKAGAIKYNWFKTGDYDYLNKFANKLDFEISKYIDEYKTKPIPDNLEELINGKNNVPTNQIKSITDLVDAYIICKKKDFESLDILQKDQRKKLERLKNIYNTLFFYCQVKQNRFIPVEDLVEPIFWIDFLKFLLFNKPRDLTDIAGIPKHNLVEVIGESEFDPGYGISNSTVDKWLRDLNTILNWCDSNSFIKENLKSIKKIQKDSVKKSGINQHRNLEAALRKKEFDWFKKDEFEMHIKPAKIDGKLVSRDGLIKAKDLFLGMTILGCRFEDFSSFNEINIIQRGQVAAKTVRRYEANINSTFLRLMEKHNYDFKISNQQFNRRIKEVFRQFYVFFKTKEDVTDRDLKYVVETHRGRYTSSKVVYKYQKIGAHSARRSFATMAYLDGHFPKQMIMEFTGHKSEREFDKYINLKVDEADFKRLALFFE